MGEFGKRLTDLTKWNKELTFKTFTGICNYV